MPKIVCLGAGSFSFGLSTLITLLKSPSLNGSEIALVDNNPESLDLISRLANWLNQEWDCQKVITSHSGHTEALKDANFVISAIEVQPREELWRQDFDLTLRYGLRQPYAENGGPGGFAHAARNVNAVLDIARAMESACPDAWFINFSNPMHRLCYLVNHYTSIKSVGLCHQLAVGYAMVAKTLAPIYGIESANDLVSTHADPKNHLPTEAMALAGMERFKIVAAGLNHFTWMLSLTDRQTGEDHYPLFRQEWLALPAEFEPLTRQIFDSFGLFPIPGDEHLCEYLPWVSCARTRPWYKYDLSLYDWDLFDALRNQQWQKISGLISERGNTDWLRNPHSEGALEIIDGLLSSEPFYWEAVNIPNDGLIEGLPADAVVEVPGVIAHNTISGVPALSLPKGITGLLQREVLTSQLNIDAVVHGDRQLALQSLLLDPVVDDLDTARAILDDILDSNQEYLPQFWQA